MSIAPTPARRILVINPNTNPAVTERVAQAARAVALPDTEIEIVNPAAGPFSVVTAADQTLATQHVLALVNARLADKFDGYVLACFDEFAIDEIIALTGRPTIGMCEAGMLAASRLGGRFSIVTTVQSAVPTIERLAQKYGVGEACTVHAAGIGVAEAAAPDSGAEKTLGATIERALDFDGAKAILLGSGALTSYADAMTVRFGVPFVDGVREAVILAEQRIDAQASTEAAP